jgi:hypothetical protein
MGHETLLRTLPGRVRDVEPELAVGGCLASAGPFRRLAERERIYRGGCPSATAMGTKLKGKADKRHAQSTPTATAANKERFIKRQISEGCSRCHSLAGRW